MIYPKLVLKLLMKTYEGDSFGERSNGFWLPRTKKWVINFGLTQPKFEWYDEKFS